MICFPNCKINLGLSIIAKRHDGFHNLETIMYPLKLNDILEIVVATDGQFDFNSTGINISGDLADNLVVRAYDLLKAEYKLAAVKIHLHKIIPIAAGLGGGSSDAAFTIKTLNKLFNLGLSVSTMQAHARELGADCPFFIENKAVVASEKGDRFETIALNLNNYYFTIIQPKIHISTPAAYSWIKPKPIKPGIKYLLDKPIEKWKYDLTNDFEEEVFIRYVEIQQIKDTLYHMGAIYASMSGSGSAVYGIFKKAVCLTNKFPEYFCWTGKGL